MTCCTFGVKRLVDDAALWGFYGVNPGKIRIKHKASFFNIAHFGACKVLANSDRSICANRIFMYRSWIIQDPYFFIPMYVYVIAPNCARPSAATVLQLALHIFFRFLRDSVLCNHTCRPNDVTHKGRQITQNLSSLRVYYTIDLNANQRCSLLRRITDQTALLGLLVNVLYPVRLVVDVQDTLSHEVITYTNSQG